jgi:hypothetical protein
MLSRAELKLPDPKLSELLRKRAAGMESDKEADESHRDLAFVFELDHQVRAGGFAQYFFNTSCPNAFDAWFASDLIDDTTNQLLSHALHRLGVEFGVDLELHRLFDEGGGDALGKAYAQLMEIYQTAHQLSGDLKEAFVAFTERLDSDKQGVPGFGKINRQYLKEVDVDAAVAEHVRADPEPFLSAPPAPSQPPGRRR